MVQAVSVWPKRSHQLEAQPQQELEVGGRPSRLPARLDGPLTSCSCWCCASSWWLRLGLAPRIMSVNSAGRSLGGPAPPPPPRAPPAFPPPPPPPPPPPIAPPP
eukprot:COSAG02_NODE_8335_length_2609_cov_5.570120_1_plen_103_part_10